MPLHLLGKKSWNVYNTANIEKVRRDEAIARAEEAAREERQQEEDAARRLSILRGEEPAPLTTEEAPKDGEFSSKRARDESRAEHHADGRPAKRPRKKAGENDTDFEMRLAERQTEEKDESRQLVLHDASKNAPITDHAGHISLFQPPKKSAADIKAEKHPEVEAAAARKKREQEDQYTMRFSNAAGRGTDVINGKAWYHTSNAIGADATDSVDEVGKDVWGNEDPLRKSREAKRVVDNDPLAFMKRGAAQVRQVEKERKKWKVEKDREIKELADEDRRRRKRRRREDRKRRHHRDESEDDLEDFRLDDSGITARDREQKRRRHTDGDDRDESTRHQHGSDKDRERQHSQSYRDSDRYRVEWQRPRHSRGDD